MLEIGGKIDKSTAFRNEAAYKLEVLSTNYTNCMKHNQKKSNLCAELATVG